MQTLTRLRTTLLTVAMMALLAAAAHADGRATLYVGKTELGGIVRHGRVFVPAGPLLKAMGFTWTAADDGYTLSAGSGSGPAISGARVTLHRGTQTVAALTVAVRGEAWIDARTVAEGLGAVYLYTPAAGVAQISLSTARIDPRRLDRVMKQAQAEAKAEAAAGRVSTSWPRGSSGGASAAEGEASATQAATPDDEPIAVERVSYSTSVTGIMTGTVVLRNDADVPVRDVFVYVTLEAPEQPTADDVTKSSGLGGTGTVPSYVKDTTDGTLPTYAGTAPTTELRSYASMGDGAAAAPSPSPSPSLLRKTEAAATSPEASPKPAPKRAVTTLPSLYVVEIPAGKTVSIPFTWKNEKNIPQVSPSVQTQHEKVAFSRKKPAEENDASTEGASKDGEATGGEKSSGAASGTDASKAPPATDAKTPAKDGGASPKADTPATDGGSK